MRDREKYDKIEFNWWSVAMSRQSWVSAMGLDHEIEKVHIIDFRTWVYEEEWFSAWIYKEYRFLAWVYGENGFFAMDFREEEHEKSMKILGVACCGSLEISGCG